MGNCLPFLRLARNKYEERLETPSQKSESISLVSEDFISCLLCTSDSSWYISQEKIISSYTDFTRTLFFQSTERVRSLSSSLSSIFSGGKDIEIFNHYGKHQAVLSGHERPANALSSNQNLLISGSSDWTVRLWDLAKLKETDKSYINWNVVTSLKWIDENSFVQTSEDLKIRIWDIRESLTICEKKSISIGDNFATCSDVRQNSIVTGHRGFSGNGCEVKMWDLRKEAEVFNCKNHDMSVEAVKFCGEGFTSCGKDGKIVRYSGDGKAIEHWVHSAGKPFNAMDNFKQGLLLANSEPKVMFFSIDPLTNQY